MVRLLFFVISFVVPIGISAQLAKLQTLKSAEFKAYINQLPMACDLSELAWQSEPSLQIARGLEGKLLVRFFGNAFDPVHRENLLQLQKFQERFAETRVVYIHSLKTGLQKKSEIEKLHSLLGALKLTLPFSVADSGYSACAITDHHCRTEIVGPDGQLFESIESLLDMEYLSNGVAEVQHRMIDHYRINRTPYTGHFGLISGVSPLMLFPQAIAADEQRDLLFIADQLANRIIILEKSGLLHAVVGNGKPGHTNGSFAEATMNKPVGLAFIAETNSLYFADSRNNRIRKINMDSLTVSDAVGNGKPAKDASLKVIGTYDALSFPTQVSAIGTTIHFQTLDGIYSFDTKTDVAELIYPFLKKGSESFSSISALDADRFAAILPEGNQPLLFENGQVQNSLIIPKGLYGNVDGRGTKVRFGALMGMGKAGNALYLINPDYKNIRIWEFERDRVMESIPFPNAYMNPEGNARTISDLCQLDGDLYGCDAWNGTILRYTKSTNTWQAMAVKGYEDLCYGYFEDINPIADTDTVRILRDNPTLTIEMPLPDNWQLDLSGIAISDVQSRNLQVTVASEAWEEGRLYLNVVAEIGTESGDITLDRVYYVQSTKYPERQFRVSDTVVIPVLIVEESSNIEPLRLKVPKL